MLTVPPETIHDNAGPPGLAASTLTTDQREVVLRRSRGRAKRWPARWEILTYPVGNARASAALLAGQGGFVVNPPTKGRRWGPGACLCPTERPVSKERGRSSERSRFGERSGCRRAGGSADWSASGRSPWLVCSGGATPRAGGRGSTDWPVGGSVPCSSPRPTSTPLARSDPGPNHCRDGRTGAALATATPPSGTVHRTDPARDRSLEQRGGTEAFDGGWF